MLARDSIGNYNFGSPSVRGLVIQLVGGSFVGDMLASAYLMCTNFFYIYMGGNGHCLKEIYGSGQLKTKEEKKTKKRSRKKGFRSYSSLWL